MPDLNSTTRAIVIGAYATGTCVVRSLGRAGVPVEVVRVHETDMAHYSRYVRQSHALPELMDDPGTIVDFLESRLPDWKGAVVIPSNDTALIGLSQNHSRLSQHFRLTCPNWDIVQNIIDKAATAAMAREVGINVPRVYGPARRSFDGSSALDFPVLVKPVQSHTFVDLFNKKLFVAHTVDELRHAIAVVEDNNIACEVQQYVAGTDEDMRMYQVYIDQTGNPHGDFVLKRLRQQPPRFGVTRAAKTCPAPELRDPSVSLLRRIGWYGAAEVEYKRDTRDGKFYMIEVNGRSLLTHSLPLRAGINYALMAYSEAVDGTISGYNPNGWKGTWVYLHADFFMTLKNLGKEDQSFGEILRSYRGPKTFAMWARDDPRPFFVQWLRSLRQIPNALLNKLKQPFRPKTQQDMQVIPSDHLRKTYR